MNARRVARMLAVAVPALTATVEHGARAADSFDAVWRDGRAEVSGYRLRVERYGHPRSGHAVLIYVTEPFSRRQLVKLDDPAVHPDDALDVLKLNLVRKFQTGIYDYATMTSLFTEARTFAPVKVAFSSFEWCGQVYEELDVRGGALEHRVASYFEGESGAGTLPVPAGGVFEDDLFVLLRGLRGDFLPPGGSRDVPFLASSFYRRLTHRAIAWSHARIERLAGTDVTAVPAGRFTTFAYRVRTDDDREGHFDIERDAPHRVVRWAWTAGPSALRGRGTFLGGTDRGELTGTSRVAYWNEHDPGDERELGPLGLPSVSPDTSRGRP
ncbi:MAG TPA: hypothetical protein VL332_08340 [Candidatus Saccharimonadaceae bacterium]|jgi:hypothetical protein|nr:hypothetical protein [Candidatus Saccharimonadaceae bacterium]